MCIRDRLKGGKYWSPGAYSALGFEEAKAPPSNEDFLERIYEGDRDNYVKNLKFARENATAFEFGFKIRGHNGELKHVFSHGAPILDNDGKTIGFDGIVVDQTHAAKALDSLESAKELLNLALINGRSVVLEHDLEKGSIRGYGALDIFDFAQDDDPKHLEDKVMRCLGRRDTPVSYTHLDVYKRQRNPSFGAPFIAYRNWARRAARFGGNCAGTFGGRWDCAFD